MAHDLVPDALRDFINRYIDSIAQLEALLMLRSSPAEGWDAGKIAKRLYIGEQEAAEVLARLSGDGFLSCTEGVYRYSCSVPEQQSMVDQLAAVYSRHLIPVTNLIHAKPRRIREFADAFKFRKDR